MASEEGANKRKLISPLCLSVHGARCWFRGHPGASFSVCVWGRGSLIEGEIRQEWEWRVGPFNCVYPVLWSCCGCMRVFWGEASLWVNMAWESSQLSLTQGRRITVERGGGPTHTGCSAVFASILPVSRSIPYVREKDRWDSPLTKHKITPLCIFNSADPAISTHLPIHSGSMLSLKALTS